MAGTMRNPAQLESLMTYWASRVGCPHPLEPTVELLTAQPWRAPPDLRLADHPV